MKENNFEKNIELKITDSLNNDNNHSYNKIDNEYSNLKNQSINLIEKYKINENDTVFGNNYIKYYIKKKNFNMSPKKMGNFYTFFFYKNEPIVAIGFKSLKLVLIYEFILQVSFFILMNTVIISGVFPYMKYLLIIFYLNSFLSHMYIFLLNPGIPTPEHFNKIILNQKNYNKNDYLYCDVCNIIIKATDGVEHCDECGICMNEYDHHCYWTGKCIAKNNSWVFVSFWLGVLIYIVWYFMIIIVWLILKMIEYKKKFKNN